LWVEPFGEFIFMVYGQYDWFQGVSKEFDELKWERLA
jgi:hypothetical protein